MLLQTFWNLFQVIYFTEIFGLIASVILTLFLLLKSGVSGNAWIYAAAAVLVLFLGGNSMYMFDGNLTIYSGIFVFIIGGYILILLALFKYIRAADRTHRVTRLQ